MKKETYDFEINKIPHKLIIKKGEWMKVIPMNTKSEGMHIINGSNGFPSEFHIDIYDENHNKIGVKNSTGVWTTSIAMGLFAAKNGREIYVVPQEQKSKEVMIRENDTHFFIYSDECLVASLSK